MGRIKLIHYHTDTLNATPKAENLALGEIAVNTNEKSPALYIKDSNDYVHPLLLGYNGGVPVLENYFGRYSNNYQINQLLRPTTANQPTGNNGGVKFFLATDSMVEGKPPIDSFILQFNMKARSPLPLCGG